MSGPCRRSWEQIRVYVGGLGSGSGPTWAVLGADQGLPDSLGSRSGPNWAVLGAERVLLGASWPLLGASWGALGASWAALGASWAPPGAVLGPLGASWAGLGASWGGPKSIKKSIRNLIRKQAESRRKNMAQTLRLSMFQSLTRVAATRMRSPQKAIKTAIDMISSYLSIHLLTPCLVALIMA